MQNIGVSEFVIRTIADLIFSVWKDDEVALMSRKSVLGNMREMLIDDVFLCSQMLSFSRDSAQ